MIFFKLKLSKRFTGSEPSSGLGFCPTKSMDSIFLPLLAENRIPIVFLQ